MAGLVARIRQRGWGEATLRGTLIALGLVGIGKGLMQLKARPTAEIWSAARWLVVPAVLSDAVLLPAVAVVGWVLTRLFRPWLRLPIQVALVVIGGLTAVAAPFLERPGLRPDNPTLLNRNYPLGFGIYLAAIVVLAAGWAVWRWRHRASPPAERATLEP